jgi:hypothetical protein
MAKESKKTRKATIDKQKELDIRKLTKEEEQRRTEEQLGRHLEDSKDRFASLREGYDEKEAMLVCSLEDEISSDDSVKSSVFDPKLSTIVFERAARVMAQAPKGKAFPVSKNDIGKSRFMNLLLNYYTKNANYWHSMIIKLRMMDLYSMVYGTMFGLVPWHINTKTGYIGPELIPLPIRSCFPQPSATSINESDWFQVSTMRSLEWLLEQKKASGWISANIDKVAKEVKGGSEDKEAEARGDIKPDWQRSYVEDEWYPEEIGDKVFPKIWLQTEYRRKKWYIFAPKYGNILLRVIDNPYKNDELPIVAKHAFPLMDSIIGLGEFERGKTLQLAINSLINLYLDGVKYSIFPPVHIDPNNVVQSSIQWEAGAKWLMKRPGVDVQHMKLSPSGLQTFQSTYSFLTAALLNQAGTTTVNQPTQVESMMGKTPQALRLQASKESARDEWDRVMMEDTIKQIYGKWIQMIVQKQSKEITVRLFGEEAKQFAKDHPDVAEFFQGENYGVVGIGKEQLASKYDYEVESGATLQKDTEAEKENLIGLLGIISKTPQIIGVMNQGGKDLDIGELFKRIIIASGIKDYDKIITDVEPGKQGMVGEQGMGPQGQPTPQGGYSKVVEPSIRDKEILKTFQAVQEMAQGGGGVPPIPRK